MSEQYLRALYATKDMSELVALTRDSEAAPIAQKLAREELDKRYASGRFDPVESASIKASRLKKDEIAVTVKKGEVSIMSVSALLIMIVMTVAGTYLLGMTAGVILAMGTAAGFGFIFPLFGRVIGCCLIILSIKLGFSIFKELPWYIAFFMQFLPLMVSTLGLYMIAGAQADE